MNTKVLERLGFTKGEIKVYISLMKLGNVTTGPLTKDSGVSNSKVYEILERLVKKGVVSKIKEKTTKFQAVHPSQLLKLYEEKEKNLLTLKDDLQQSLPELEEYYNAVENKQEVSVFQGFKGIKSVFNRIYQTLNKGDKYEIFSIVEPPKNFSTFMHHWTQSLGKKKIKCKLLFDQNTPQRHLDKVKSYSPQFDVRKNPYPFVSSTVFNLYKDSTAIILWSEKPVAVVIDNKEMTDGFRKYFNVLWKSAKN